MKVKRHRHFNSLFDLEIEKEICNDYLIGLSSINIAKKYKCTGPLILRILKNNNVTIRRSGPANWSESNFWKWVDTKGKNDCWNWLASKDKDGYGSCNHTKAHRVSYQIHFNKNIKGKLVCHTCDNPSCVNPNHLFLGTIQQNNKDCCDKGRQARGEKSAKAILNENKINKIREAHSKGISLKKLAKKYKVHWTTINLIVKRKTWKHI